MSKARKPGKTNCFESGDDILSYSRKLRKSVKSYAEQTNRCDDSDSEFEVEKSKTINYDSGGSSGDEKGELPESRSRKRKTLNKNKSNICFPGLVGDSKLSKKSKFFASSTTVFGTRPNLSEDDSSDDDIPIVKFKTNANIKGESKKKNLSIHPILSESNKTVTNDLSESSKTVTKNLSESSKIFSKSATESNKNVTKNATKSNKTVTKDLMKANKNIVKSLNESNENLTELKSIASKDLEKPNEKVAKNMTKLSDNAIKKIIKSNQNVDKSSTKRRGSIRKNLTNSSADISKNVSVVIEDVSKNTKKSKEAARKNLIKLNNKDILGSDVVNIKQTNNVSTHDRNIRATEKGRRVNKLISNESNIKVSPENERKGKHVVVRNTSSRKNNKKLNMETENTEEQVKFNDGDLKSKHCRKKTDVKMKQNRLTNMSVNRVSNVRSETREKQKLLVELERSKHAKGVASESSSDGDEESDENWEDVDGIFSLKLGYKVYYLLFVI